MTTQAVNPLRWNTASYSSTEGTAANDLSALGAHYRNCNGCKGRCFTIQCAIDAINSFVAPRFMTTLVVTGTVLAVAAAAF